MAAVLACGPGAVLSHRDAAALWGIRNDHRAKIDVTVPGRRRGPASVTVHESPLADDERTTRAGIPVTTLFRTIIDLSTAVNDAQLRRAMNEAERQGPQPPPSLASLCERHAGRAGIARVRELGGLTPRLTRSELEDAFLAYCERHALPLPQTNIVLAGYEVDCSWADHRLVAELDGYEFHRTRIDLADDHAKQQDLQAAGYAVTRIAREHLQTPRLAHRLRAMMRA